MKKVIVPIILVIVFIVFAIIFLVSKNDKKEISNNTEFINKDKVQNNEISNNTITENKADESMNTAYIKVNNNVLNIELEDNSATIELKERLKNGDIVLYQGNQISLFYNSNSWSYTKLGKIQNVSSSELKKILGNGDVTITFTLSR